MRGPLALSGPSVCLRSVPGHSNVKSRACRRRLTSVVTSHYTQNPWPAGITECNRDVMPIIRVVQPRTFEIPKSPLSGRTQWARVPFFVEWVNEEIDCRECGSTPKTHIF